MKPRIPTPKPTKWHSEDRKIPQYYCSVCGCELLVGQGAACDKCIQDIEDGLYDITAEYEECNPKWCDCPLCQPVRD